MLSSTCLGSSRGQICEWLSPEAEVRADIRRLVNMAALQLRQKSPAAVAATDIHIFTDSMSCLNFLGCMAKPKSILHNLGMTPVWRFIKRSSHELRDLGAHLTLSFHPGHGHDVEGHAVADNASFEAFLKGTGNLQLLDSENSSDSPAASDSASPAQQGNEPNPEGHTAAHDAADEAHTKESSKLHLPESDSPTESASSEEALQGNDNDIEGDAEQRLLHGPIQSPSTGPDSTCAEHRDNNVVYQSKTSERHNSFWRVFHSLSTTNIEAFRRQNPPTPAEERMVRELRELYRDGAPEGRDEADEWRRATRHLKKLVGHLL